LNNIINGYVKDAATARGVNKEKDVHCWECMDKGWNRVGYGGMNIEFCKCEKGKERKKIIEKAEWKLYKFNRKMEKERKPYKEAVRNAWEKNYREIQVDLEQPGCERRRR